MRCGRTQKISALRHQLEFFIPLSVLTSTVYRSRFYAKATADEATTSLHASQWQVQRP